MPAATLRITHAGTGAEEVYLDAELLDDALSTEAAAEADGVTRGEVVVTVVTGALLGAPVKPVPDGRHRCALDVGGERVLDGYLTNESVAHGRLYPDADAGPVRRWSLRLHSGALEDTMERLDAVRLPDVAALARTLGAVRTVTTGVVGGTVEEEALDWWHLGTLLVACQGGGDSFVVVREAGTEFEAVVRWVPAVAGVPVPGEPVRTTVIPAGRISLCAPGRLQELGGDGDADPDVTCPDWSGAELLELLATALRLLVAPAYADYPDDLIILNVRPGGWREPAVPAPAADGLGDDYDWSTEPAAGADGEAAADFALTYRGGPDGSRLGAVDVADAPEAATYAATRWALRTPREAGQPREVLNGSTLELPVLLPGFTDVTAVTAAVLPDGFGEVLGVGTPCVAADAGEGDVYIASLVEHPALSGTWRAVAYRGMDAACAPADGEPPHTHELWARQLWPYHALDAGDVDVVEVEGSAADLADGDGDPYVPSAGDPARGVTLEGLPWVAERVREGHDDGALALRLVRPAVAPPRPALAEAPAPAVHIVVTFPDGFLSIATYLRVPLSVSTPAFEVEVRDATDVLLEALGPLTQYNYSAFFYTGAVGEDPSGYTVRARAHYGDGRVTDWVDTVLP